MPPTRFRPRTSARRSPGQPRALRSSAAAKALGASKSRASAPERTERRGTGGAVPGLKLVIGTGTRDPVKWVHGKYPPKEPGGPRRIQAVAPRMPYVISLKLYESPEPTVMP
jgi:hypothetical protein